MENINKKDLGVLLYGLDLTTLNKNLLPKIIKEVLYYEQLRPELYNEEITCIRPQLNLEVLRYDFIYIHEESLSSIRKTYSQIEQLILSSKNPIAKDPKDEKKLDLLYIELQIKLYTHRVISTKHLKYEIIFMLINLEVSLEKIKETLQDFNELTDEQQEQWYGEILNIHKARYPLNQKESLEYYQNQKQFVQLADSLQKNIEYTTKTKKEKIAIIEENLALEAKKTNLQKQLGLDPDIYKTWESETLNMKRKQDFYDNDFKARYADLKNRTFKSFNSAFRTWKSRNR